MKFSKIENPSSQELPDPSRRKFLRDIGMATMGALAAEATRHLATNQAEHFTSGDTIETKIGKFTIDGWTIKAAHLNFRQNTTVEIIEPVLTQTAEINIDSNHIRFQNCRLDLTDTAGLTFPVLPKPDQPILIRITEREESKITYDKTYTIYPKIFKTHSIGGPELYSEVPLHKETSEKISGVQKDLSSLTKTPIWIQNIDDKHTSFRHEQKEDAILVSAERLSSNERNSLLVGITHELAHSIVNNFRHSKSQKAHLRVYQWYEKITGRDEFIFWGPSKDDMQELTNLFRESTYDKNNPKNMDGHPYENYDELFASMLTVMRLYPKELVARVNALTGDKADKALTGELSDWQKTTKRWQEVMDKLSVIDVRRVIKEYIELISDELKIRIAKKGNLNFATEANIALNSIIPEIEYLSQELNLEGIEEDIGLVRNELAELKALEERQ